MFLLSILHERDLILLSISVRYLVKTVVLTGVSRSRSLDCKIGELHLVAGCKKQLANFTKLPLFLQD
jgi:hypothetical protein